MTHIDLDALQAAAEAATRGPWDGGDICIDPKTGEGHNFSCGDVYITPPIGEIGPVAIAAGESNGAFITAANPAVILALIDRLRKAEAVPEGYKLVPTEPTAAMIDSAGIEGNEEYWFGNQRNADDFVADIYRAMIEAAPIGADSKEGRGNT